MKIKILLFTLPLFLLAQESILSPSNKLYEQGGNILILLMLLSIIGFILVFIQITQTPRYYSTKIVPKIIQLLEKKDYTNIQNITRKDPSIIAQIIHEIIHEYNREDTLDNQTLYKLIEHKGTRKIKKIDIQNKYILEIASLSPMLGLLGTVVGMYDSFAHFDESLNSITPTIIGSGIAKALITTIVGISLSITFQFIYSILNGKKQNAVKKIESASLSLYQKIKK